MYRTVGSRSNPLSYLEVMGPGVKEECGALRRPSKLERLGSIPGKGSADFAKERFKDRLTFNRQIRRKLLDRTGLK
jgi:hypothetical protein